MSQNFKTFEKQYANSSASAINQLNQYEQTKESQYLHSAQKYLDELQDLVEQMEFESSNHRESRKNALNYKKEFVNIEKRWKSLREEQTRAQLFAKTNANNASNTSNSNGDSSHATSTFTNSTNSANSNPNSSDKHTLLQNDRLERSTRKLKDGYRVALDTEAHGMDILNELQREREVLERSKNRLNHANNMLGSSANIVTQMYRHVIQDRVMLYLIFGIICFIIFVVIITKIT